MKDGQHLTEMVSLMGPPPKAVLERTPTCYNYQDVEGNWIITISITEHLLVTRETQLEGRDNEMNLGTWRGFKT
ncbi:hypothetical protein V2G26_019651 [Clonostachys chloroleuca]